MSERSRAKMACIISGAVRDWAIKHGMIVLRPRVTGDLLGIAVALHHVFANELTQPLDNVLFTIERDIRHWDETSGLGDPVQNVQSELDTKLQEWVCKGDQK